MHTCVRLLRAAAFFFATRTLVCFLLFMGLLPFFLSLYLCADIWGLCVCTITPDTGQLQNHLARAHVHVCVACLKSGQPRCAPLQFGCMPLIRLFCDAAGSIRLFDPAFLDNFEDYVLQSSGLMPVGGASWETLRQLAKDAAMLASRGLEPSTQAKYELNLKHVVTIHPDLIPMDSTGKLMMFFSTLKGTSEGKVKSYRSAIAALHRIRGWAPPPFEAGVVKAFWDGLLKSCNNQVVGKEPITKQQFTDMVLHWLNKQSTAGMRNAFVAVMQFYGMRRISEVLALTRDQIEDLGEGKGVVIRVTRSKNDRFGRGMEVPIPDKSKEGIPLGQIIRVFLHHTRDLQGVLLRASSGKHGWSPEPLSRDTWNTAVKDAFKVLYPGLPTKNFSSHSFRKGGFTAARQAGMPHDCSIDIIGHKQGGDAYLAYLKRPREEKMQWIAQI
jgi:integrase